MKVQIQQPKYQLKRQHRNVGKTHEITNHKYNIRKTIKHKENNNANTTHVRLLTPWSRVLFEKLTGSHLVKTLPAFYGNRRFITAFTSVRHLSLS